jgi:hypothetical protein
MSRAAERHRAIPPITCDPPPHSSVDQRNPDGYKELDLEYEYEVDPKKVPWQLTLSAGTAGTDATATLTTEGVGDACNCWVHAHVPRLALEAVGAHVQ